MNAFRVSQWIRKYWQLPGFVVAMLLFAGMIWIATHFAAKDTSSNIERCRKSYCSEGVPEYVIPPEEYYSGVCVCLAGATPRMP